MERGKYAKVAWRGKYAKVAWRERGHTNQNKMAAKKIRMDGYTFALTPGKQHDLAGLQREYLLLRAEGRLSVHKAGYGENEHAIIRARRKDEVREFHVDCMYVDGTIEQQLAGNRSVFFVTLDDVIDYCSK